MFGQFGDLRGLSSGLTAATTSTARWALASAVAAARVHIGVWRKMTSSTGKLAPLLLKVTFEPSVYVTMTSKYEMEVLVSTFVEKP